jgi:hypothetical protein
VTVEAPREIVCASCGSRYLLSARNVRAWRQRGETPVCARCRHPAKPVDPATMIRMRRWWLDRYSIEELLELGDMLGWRCP